MDIVKNIIEKNINGIDESDVIVGPVGPRIIFEPYEKNPYKSLEIENGLIIGTEGSNTYKSNQSGEIEENEEGIICAKVISVGEACKWVKPGDDIFVMAMYATPIPFRNKKWKEVDENNAMAFIRKK